MLEGLARWLDPQLPRWRGEDSAAVVMTGHPERLWGLGEGVRDNAGTQATISSLGIRAPIPAVPRPEGGERIMVIGDSTFFGYGLADDATLSALLDRRLQDKADTVNGAIPGYSTEQARLLMEDVGWAQEPTLLLIGCLWSDTNFAPYPDSDLLRTRAAASGAWLAHSALARLLAGQLRLGGVVSWTRFDSLPAPRNRRVPVTAYAENLDWLVREAASRGIGAALITPPEAVEITQSARPPHHWGPYLSAQAKVAAHHNIPHIQTTAALRSHYETAVARGMDPDTARGALFLDDLHPTKLGQTLMAGVVLGALAEHGWPEKRLEGQQQPFSQSIEDGVRLSRGHQSGRSPMNNIFPHEGSSRAQSPGPRAKEDTPSHPPPSPQMKKGSKDAWSIHGEVMARMPDGPCRVRALDSRGHTVASATLTRQGSYRLRMPEEISQVSVVLEGSLCQGEGHASRADGGKVRLTSQKK